MLEYMSGCAIFVCVLVEKRSCVTGSDYMYVRKELFLLVTSTEAVSSLVM